ncbi:MAG: beta-ketoacyl-ACP synthase II [Legionellales bacterium]|nr:beta-ketoacyl-ACP synthase II [Legionellales bacterium]
MSKRRVVITGLGAVSPLGLSVDETWQNVLASQCGVALAECEGIEDNTCKISASVKNFDPIAHDIPAKLVRKTDLFIQYGLAASIQAIKDAGITPHPENAHRYGVALGSGIGGLPLIQYSQDFLRENPPRRFSPMFIPGVIINMLAGHISIEYGLKGPNLAIVTACTTGTHNIGMAARLIAYNDADVMVAGGSEMATCSLGLVGFSAMRALSKRNEEPTKASRPWDSDRDGFVLGDGAATLVLEEYEHAKKRGAKIYAELVGFGMSADAYHMTLPEGIGAEHAMSNALKDAGLSADAVDYINAHATSTPAGDTQELVAIGNVFGEHAKQIPISSTKSMTGHLLGAAGAIEAIFSILALRDQVAPATINLDNPDEAVNGYNLVPHQAQESRINISLSNSFGFGGTNGCLIFKSL